LSRNGVYTYCHLSSNNDYKNGPGQLLDWFITTIDPGQVIKQLNCIINPINHW
jgi:hypothetical protein